MPENGKTSVRQQILDVRAAVGGGPEVFLGDLFEGQKAMALGAHGGDLPRLVTASSMLLFHAPVILAAVLLRDRQDEAQRQRQLEGIPGFGVRYDHEQGLLSSTSTAPRIAETLGGKRGLLRSTCDRT